MQRRSPERVEHIKNKNLSINKQSTKKNPINPNKQANKKTLDRPVTSNLTQHSTDQQTLKGSADTNHGETGEVAQQVKTQRYEQVVNSATANREKETQESIPASANANREKETQGSIPASTSQHNIATPGQQKTEDTSQQTLPDIAASTKELSLSDTADKKE